MASVIIERPDGEEEVGLWCPGDTPCYDAKVMFVSAAFLLNPPWPWEVTIPKGEPKGRETGLEYARIRLPAGKRRPSRIWTLTLRTHDGPQGMFEAAWPD